MPLDADYAVAGGFDARRPEIALEVGELFGAIAALPPTVREAIVAVDIAGLSYREAATALGVRQTTLTTRLYRARQQLARSLAAEPATGPR